MKHIPARVLSLIYLTGLVVFVVGFFAKIDTFIIIGGSISVLDNVIGTIVGFVVPVFPIILAIVGGVVGFIAFDHWYVGVFWASIIFSLVDVPQNFNWVIRPEKAVRMVDRGADSW